MSDNVNRLIQKAKIDEERAARLLEEMAVMEDQITTLRAQVAAERDRALEDAAQVAYDRSSDFFATPGYAAAPYIAAAIRALKETKHDMPT